MARHRVLALVGAAGLIAPDVAVAQNCAQTSVGFSPFLDPPPVVYKGEPTGLYPGGAAVRPPEHEAAGVLLASQVGPLDPAGSLDPASGRIGLLAVGFSNTLAEADAFQQLSDADSLRHPAVQVVNGAEGGASAEVISNPVDPYWGRLMTTITGAGLMPAQIQVVWYKDANPNPAGGFPAHALALESQNTAVMQNLAILFPNLRQVFVASRIYGGYAGTTLSPEPYAYESAFAYKWMIEKQINGDPALNHDPQLGPVTAPWISWGPYLWADGLTPRSDGLIWACSDFAMDGTHPSAAGAAKVAVLLRDFFRTDTATMPWYLQAGATGVEAPPSATAWTMQAAQPNPFALAVRIPLDLPGAMRVHAAVYSPQGRRVRDLGYRELAAGRHGLSWDGRDDAGRSVTAGTYFVRVTAPDGARTAKVTLLR